VLLGAFGILSLTLVAVGLYGLLSHMVAQETREIGVRIALGAPPRSIIRGVLLRGGKLLAGGIALGLAAGAALKRSLDTLVFGLSAADPGNLLAACLVLLAVAAIACCLPARRASAVDRIVVLKGE
jgi:putative ABC transport system permease protein